MSSRNSELLREARKQGWSVELRRGGHVRLTPPNSSSPIFIPATPSDRRALMNAVTRMRRAGFVWKGR